MIVALYARVSTSKQAEEDLSIPDQLGQMRAWCKGQGHTIAAEYVEPGASATDDRRPVFQKMIEEACVTPAPFEAIIVHSLSRFFRDSLEFGLYERRLKRFGVRVVSITQQTSDDPSGEMIRRIFSVFDEYQSKENGKHTLRAMRENARQGYCNGSLPPIGYRTVAVEVQGNKGKKKRLEVNPGEAAVVRRVFELYLTGTRGEDLGIKSIAAHLNEEGLTIRGRPWTKNHVNDLLTNRTYIGEHYFNRWEKRGGLVRKMKPQSEWVLIKVEPIIEEERFAEVQEKLRSRSPEQVPARLVTSPTLLTGLLKCDLCGSGMTLATGKGGKYRYYKCTNRILKGKNACSSANVSTKEADRLVLTTLAEKIFAPARVQRMLESLRKRLTHSQSDLDGRIKRLTKGLEDLQQRTTQLYEAVEKGLLPLDSSLTERAQKIQGQRQAILTEIAGLRRVKQMPAAALSPNQVKTFASALKDRLLDRDSLFGKKYLKLLVKEIRYGNGELVLKGNYMALAQAVGGNGAGTPSGGVPSHVLDWLPGQDSNLRPIG